jgi:hypothetical protein
MRVKERLSLQIEGVLEGRSPSNITISPSLIREGDKRVPRKIKDFSGCLKGIGLLSKYPKRLPIKTLDF